MARKRRVLRSNIKMLLTLLVIALIIATVIFLIIRSSGGFVENGTIEFLKPDIDIVIIRDEMVVSSEEYGKITFLADEKEKVTAGSIVAQVYKWGYNENTLQSLLTTQQDIRKYQLSKSVDVVNRDLDALDASINEKIAEIIDCFKKQNDLDMLTLERELEELLAQRLEFLKASTQTDLDLSELYAKEQADLDLLNSYKKDLLAQEAGVISFYYDGYESLFNADTIDHLNASDIQALKSGKTVKSTGVSNQRALYRLINENIWYVVISVPSSSTEKYIMGETYHISLSGYYDKIYAGTVVHENIGKSEGIYILEINDTVEEIANTRLAKATISAEFEGLSVPADAIVTNSGQTGIYILRDKQKLFVEVEVLHSNGKKAIIRCADPLVGRGSQFAYK